MGRPRKPTAQKKIEGTHRPDRAPRNEPKPEVKAPSCPTWLDVEAKREWRRVVPYLVRLGLVSIVDRAALAAYCQNFARWYRAEKLIKELGLTMSTDKGYVMQRPEVGIANSAMKQMLKFMTEFGMTPSARSSIEIDMPAESATKKDPWDELARRRRTGSA